MKIVGIAYGSILNPLNILPSPTLSPGQDNYNYANISQTYTDKKVAKYAQFFFRLYTEKIAKLSAKVFWGYYGHIR